MTRRRRSWFSANFLAPSRSTALAAAALVSSAVFGTMALQDIAALDERDGPAAGAAGLLAAPSAGSAPAAPAGIVPAAWRPQALEVAGPPARPSRPTATARAPRAARVVRADRGKSADVRVASMPVRVAISAPTYDDAFAASP